MDLFTHPSCLEHLVSLGHPERPERLGAVLDHLRSIDIWSELDVFQARAASRTDLERVHSQQLVAEVEALIPESGILQIEIDTSISPKSFEAASCAVGAVIEAVRRTLAGTSDRAFCAVRPPGHHAESSAVMGFCLFNSIAVGADVALDSLERVAVLDFDVHHCNGTVEMFGGRPEVLVCSTFQFPFYPGRFQQVQHPNIVNCPLPAGADGNLFRDRVESEWLPALELHQPELILVSAGFDAHREDPLAQINLEDEDFRWITETIVSIADRYAMGRIVSVLEGGYNLDALSRCVALHVEGLA